MLNIASEPDQFVRSSEQSRVQRGTIHRSSAIEEVINDELLRTVFQPIVDLGSGATMGLECLTRGPEGSELESPAALFAAAGAAGLVTELDWACRVAAIRTALDRQVEKHLHLFINIEPSSFARRVPEHVSDVIRQGLHELSIVIEITERAITADPAALLNTLARIRAAGCNVAIDDLGVERGSLAFLPFVEPDVIKIDMSLVQQPLTPRSTAIAAAVAADAERRGALVVCEGIETADDRERALILGADLGQGWLFGRPTSLPEVDIAVGAESAPPIQLRSSSAAPALTPWSLVRDSPRRRRTTKRELMPISHHLEQSGSYDRSATVVLGAFQRADFFTAATLRRYSAIAAESGFVAALGVEIPEQPVAGVRGVRIPVDHPLQGVWAVMVVGPFYAAALIAQDLGDTGPDDARRFDYVTTYDRPVVIAAARSLMQHITDDDSN